MTVSRYGHLWSAPVVVDVGVRTEWEPPPLRAVLWVSDLAPASIAYCLSSNVQTHLRYHEEKVRVVARAKVQKFARDAT